MQEGGGEAAALKALPTRACLERRLRECWGCGRGGGGACHLTKYLNGWDKGEVSNQDNPQLGGHVLHDGPALVAQSWGKRRYAQRSGHSLPLVLPQAKQNYNQT